MEKQYYIAYGSNMDEEQMALRCPDAVIVGKTELTGYELLFKGTGSKFYATVEEKAGASVPVIIWSITPSDEKELDEYECYPELYYKRDLAVSADGKTLTAMIYLMTEMQVPGEPSPGYYETIRNAYQKFGFEESLLQAALKNSSPKL